ncbi:YqgE/AlgH family protein, partial [Thioclava sp. BHET1]
MTASTETIDLTGKFLIAMPGMEDPRFDHSLIFLCAHSEDGAMGLIVNKPLPEPGFATLLEQLEIVPAPGVAAVPVHFGGPVETARGFVLHSADYSAGGTTMQVDAHFAMTATVEILQDLAEGTGPRRALLALGYAGWGPGQLEGEILRNGWLTCDASEELVFSNESATLWERALKTLGVDAI